MLGKITPGAEREPDRIMRLADSPDPVDQNRFLPGVIVAGRYRIVGLVGKGGMGEVYRADDLRLGQPVALKFLPEALAGDATRMARFLGEVRMARQVSHSSVCRVYDIGEADHRHFISMEYVDGEDLASLLRRIGRLPQDKAVVVARQICAGLSAAHDKGILHRDLKPANIMIDGRGHVRITDFGLAVLEDGTGAQNDRAGTPYYMAPEQLAGKPLSVQSDLYALGLILYELFTGSPAFHAGSMAELVRAREESGPPSPSSRVAGLDPQIERVILRCLQRVPDDRPASALAVAASLPGGDPLRAALEAGETPSPELVAAAGAKGGLGTRQAWACFSGVVVGLAAALVLAGSSQITAFVPLELPPQVLEHRAREILHQLGYSAPFRDSAFGFTGEGDYLRHVAREDHSPWRWQTLRGGRPPAVSFWYRQSPQLLVPSLFGRRWPDRDDPPLTTPGMEQVVLDTQGRLTSLTVVPPRLIEPAGSTATPEWAGLFAEAGLEQGTFQPVPPSSIPPVYADTRAAWAGALSALPIRIEAAALKGRPISFEMIYPWRSTPQGDPETTTAWQDARRIASAVFELGFLLGAALVARRNLRQGRGHREGAFRLAAFTFVVRMFTWLFGAPHVLGGEEMNLLLGNLAYALFDSAELWILYIALEPTLRRLWPEGIVAWVRALDGRLLDPLVARDALIGTLLGVLAAMVAPLIRIVLPWLGLQSPSPDAPTNLLGLRGLRYLVSLLFWAPISALEVSLFCVAFLLLARILLRRWWLAVLAVPLGMLSFVDLPDGSRLATLIFAACGMTFGLIALLRFGVLTWVVSCFAAVLLSSFPLTVDLTSWYAAGTLLVASVLVAMATYGLKVSLHGHSVIAPALARAQA
ncbi:MAG: hypothetical protein AUI47_11580 [Acidobacteria bacterium 13_1_40CM_2_68_5]|nr:MAG: hypothetical protein AUI47_11580 [Acidobacteria bacterium 13_1_40CM_2_68_5]